MGGEAMLGAAAQYPEIQAIAADGATRRSTAELLALESVRPLVRNFTARVMYLTVQLLSGETPPHPLLDSMITSGSTRFLLIAAGGDALETSFNQLFATTLGSRASLWIAPQVEHMGAFPRYPQEYEQRVIAFFESGLMEAQGDTREWGENWQHAAPNAACCSPKSPAPELTNTPFSNQLRRS
jgi:hypothetical protein